MPKNKHWALLKPTENTVAGLQLGKLMNMAWTPGFRPVEVVLNGDYIGLYFITETIRIDENRVNIYKQQDQETNPELIKGGWLVEVDNYLDEDQITIPECSKWNLTLRYHSPEDLSNAQSQWLTDEFKSINAAVYSADKTSTAWEDYIDVESMARFFILQEVMDNPDGFHGSFYLHKDLADDARWAAGPIWDLVCYNREKTDYTFRMKVHYGFAPHWIGEIIQYDSFCKSVELVWSEVYPNRLSEIYNQIDEIVLPLGSAWANDCARWNEDPTQTAQLRADRIKNALRRNIEWFDKHLPVSQYASAQIPVKDNSDTSVMVYNLQGIFIGKFKNEAEAISSLKKESILLTSGNSGLNDETICPIGAYSNLACSGIYIMLQHRGSIIIVFDSYSYDFFCKELRHHYQWRGDSEQSIEHLSLKNTKDGGFFDVFFRNFAIGKTKTAHYEPRKPTTFVFSRL